MLVLGEFDWPVRVHCEPPDRDFTARFKLLPLDRGLALRASLGEQNPVETLLDLLRECWIGWRDIEDAQGRRLAFSPEARERLLSDQAVVRAVAVALKDGMKEHQ